MRIYGTGLLQSMRIAFRNMLRKPITVQYPHEKLVLPERARWAVAHKFYEDGEPKCTACLACERACPDFVIQILLTTNEDRTKHIDHYRYEIGACMMCGLCVEACPFDAIEMSHNYELARIGADLLTVDLLTDVPAAQAKKRAEAAAAVAREPIAADKPAGADATPARPGGPAPAGDAPSPSGARIGPLPRTGSGWDDETPSQASSPDAPEGGDDA